MCFLIDFSGLPFVYLFVPVVCVCIVFVYLRFVLASGGVAGTMSCYVVSAPALNHISLWSRWSK